MAHTVVRFFSPRTGRVFPFDFTKDGERLEIQGRYIVSVNDSNAYLAAGLAGLGIIQGPTFMVQRHVARGELEPVLGDWWSEPIPVYVVYPPNRHLSTQGAHLRRLGRRPVREPRPDPEAHRRCPTACCARAATCPRRRRL